MAGRGRWALLAVIVGCVALTATILAQTRPRTTQTAPRTSATQQKNAGNTAVEIKPAERKPLTYYTSGVRADIFGSGQATEQAAKPAQTKAPELTPAPTPEVIDPFADYAYTGSIIMGDQALALVENSKTKEGSYVKVGDQLLGGIVAQVTERSVTVSVAGKLRTLYKTEDFKLTPLDKDAAFRTQQQNPMGMPGMGMPGMPGMPPGGMMPGMGGPGMQRFQNMTPEQMQQMRNRFMNRSFERGNTRRRFF